MPTTTPNPLTALPPILRLGTRGSLLARTQSQLVADLLKPHLPPHCTIHLIPITTSGDTLSASLNSPATSRPHPTAQTFDKGLFVQEIDDQLLSRKIDFAVHSAKDLPADRPAGITLAAAPPRENPADVWIGHNGISIADLPQNAKVGTASLRRQAQLLILRPDLLIVPLRGNIDTRLRKVAQGENNLAGTFLAAAGLLRTNLLPPHAIYLPTDQFIPAAGQGTLALEARTASDSPADAAILSLLNFINDPLAAAALTFERHIVRALAAGCLAPIGVCAEPRNPPVPTTPSDPANLSDSGWIARAIIASPDGRQAARCTLMDRSTYPPASAGLQALAPLMLETLERRGAQAILKECAR